MPIELQPFQNKTAQIAALMNYTLTNDEFSAHPLEILEQATKTSSYHCVLISDNGIIAGFFVLDGGNDLTTYTAEPNALLLRGYSIDSSLQGKGYGTKSLAALKDYVRAHFRGIASIVLAVNKRNTPAQKLYLKSGFIETPRVVLGPRGEQFVYELRI